MSALRLLPVFSLVAGLLTGLLIVCQDQATLVSVDAADSDRSLTGLRTLSQEDVTDSGNQQRIKRLSLLLEGVSEDQAEAKPLRAQPHSRKAIVSHSGAAGKYADADGSQLHEKRERPANEEGLLGSQHNQQSIQTAAEKEQSTESEQSRVVKEMDDISEREEDFDNPMSLASLANSLAE